MSAVHAKRRSAPGPRGSLLMGNLAAYKQDPITMLLRLQQQHGDIVYNRMGPFVTHALAHPDYVQHVLQDNQRNYVRGRFYENFKLFFGDGLLTTDGEFWRRHRRAVQPLFHKNDVSGQATMVNMAVEEMVQRWRRIPQGEAHDVVDDMMELSLNALGKMVFNVDISKYAATVGPSVRFGLQAMMPQGNLNDFMPRWVPTPFNLRIKRTRAVIDTIVAQIIDDHRMGKVETSDLINLMLEHRHPETGVQMTEQEVHDEVMTVFLAGHETTGSGLAWALYALAQHPHVMRRLREELDTVLGGRAPLDQDFANLPYLDQVVNEALRMYPPIWGFTRDLINDDEIGGYHIPGGSSVFVSPYVTHRHPEFWTNPNAFDPENFAPGQPARHKFAFFPFGGGMRKCIGVHMALLQMRAVLAMVIQHFDLAALPGHPIVHGALISLRPLEGIRLYIQPRAPVQRAAQPPVERRAAPAPQEQAPVAACPFAASAQAAAAPPPAAPFPAAPAPAPQPAPQLETHQVPVRRFTWHPTPIDSLPDTPAANLAGKRIVVLNGSPGTAERVAVALGRASARVSVFAPPPDADVPAAARALAQAAGPFDGVIDLGLEQGFRLDAASDWEAPMRVTVGMLQACYEDWLSEQACDRLFYLAVTWIDGQMGYAGGGADPASQPLGGLWAGLAKTLPQELPNCNVRVLDIAPSDTAEAPRRIISELYRWGLFEVGYHQGRRYALQARQEETKGPATPALRAGDVVLMSGGARGIGLLCARALAASTGATVVVTGREAAPDGSELWMQMNEDEFRAYGQAQIRQATPQNPPAAIRKVLTRLRKRRELRHALDNLQASGLAVRYEVCDIADPVAVSALCAAIGPALRVVIHNAGVDQPVRLAGKSADNFIATVRTKVLGFANLCSAASAHGQLVQFCNVGSLTGRMGGMTGETDYAAANEALARLGLWARRHVLDCSVKTLVWPTWDEVGMITNFDVAKRYVTPMAQADGVYHWLRELGDAGSGEIMFMGAVGRALTPVQIKGFLPMFGLPNINDLITRSHHVGTPQRFQPFAHFATRYTIERRSAPWLRAFRLAGQPALPVSLLLEHACWAGGWLTPEDMRVMSLATIVNIRVELAALRVPDTETLVLETEGSGYWLGQDWHVDVKIGRAGDELLRLTLVHRDPDAAAAPHALLDLPGAQAVAAVVGPKHAAWSGQLLRSVDWVKQGGLAAGRAANADAADLWALQHTPDLRLPVNHVENALRLLWHRETGEGAVALRIGRLTLAGTAGDAAWIVEQPDGRVAIADTEGRPVLLLDELALEYGASAIQPESENLLRSAP